MHRHRHRLLDPQPDGVRQPDRRRLPDRRRPGRRRRVGGAVRLPGDSSRISTGTAIAVSLSQNWNAWTNVIERMPPATTLSMTTRPTTSGADPARGAGDRPQGQPGALELRQQVEPADPDHEQRGEPPHGARAEPDLGEVRQRVGARAAQRGGDQREQHEVAGRVPDRVPEDVDAEGQHQPGDPEEAAPPTGTPRRWRRRSSAGRSSGWRRRSRDVVRDSRSPTAPTPTVAIADRDEDRRTGRRARRRCRSDDHAPVSPLDDLGEVPLGPLGGAHVPPGRRRAERVDAHPEQQPGQRHGEDPDAGQPRARP